ncbi:Ubiquitin-conjugating enzyme E2 22 [Hibiscus syriacus]|uniref:Ubiquitin-conjugating enzyme E2 22 n=1 Tax=Hibiscus syriacus TaxID=106335 RepID=A0A6A3AZG2_HIBSY|nr:Ubiquitin-conjugating enzyme E2 22 [Hibiscus syriacus]
MSSRRGSKPKKLGSSNSKAINSPSSSTTSSSKQFLETFINYKSSPASSSARSKPQYIYYENLLVDDDRSKENVTVIVRFRPLSQREIRLGEEIACSCVSPFHGFHIDWVGDKMLLRCPHLLQGKEGERERKKQEEEIESEKSISKKIKLSTPNEKSQFDIAFSVSDVKDTYKDAALEPKWKAFQTVIFLERAFLLGLLFFPHHAGTPYENGVFRMKLLLSRDFPHSPPKEQVFRCLLIEPFPESTLNELAGKMLLENYDQYARHARLYTGIHAKPKPKFKSGAIWESTTALNVEQHNTSILNVEQKNAASVAELSLNVGLHG